MKLDVSSSCLITYLPIFHPSLSVLCGESFFDQTGRPLQSARARLRELPILGLAAAVLFVLAMDNMFKVPLRQPYPGVFFFFLWGLLLAQLQASGTRAGAR